jgi:hypothetical protein
MHCANGAAPFFALVIMDSRFAPELVIGPATSGDNALRA